MSTLKPTAFQPLPISAIQPAGWLKQQLRIQADGLSGHIDEFWPDIRDSRWFGGNADGWERAPYWLDGAVPLAWQVGDKPLMDRIRSHIEYIIAHQEECGWLGPRIADTKRSFGHSMKHRVIPTGIRLVCVAIAVSLLVLLSGEVRAQGAAADGGFVYSSFTGDGEDGLHLLTSLDGKTWKAVKNYASLYRQSDGLMRDPSICLGGDGEYHLVWTTGWWDDTLGIAHSKDLIHWTPSQRLYPWADYKSAGDEESDGKQWAADLTKRVDRKPKVRNCWAPEIFYDDLTKEYVIFWATTIDDPKVFAKTWDAKRWERMNQRIYYISTKDFKTYTPRRFFYAKEDRVVIDACIARVGPKDYRMVVKDELAQRLHVCFPTKPLTTWAAMPQDYWGPMSERAFTGPGVRPDNTNAEGPSVVQAGADWFIYCDYWQAQRNGLFATRDFKTMERLNDQFKAPAWVCHGTVFRAPKTLIDALNNL